MSTNGTCIECTHWSLKDTDRSMARLGFARCLKKKLPGHTVSSEAVACEKLAPIGKEIEASRRAWLEKQGDRSNASA